MAETFQQTLKRRATERRSFTGAGAAPIREEQEAVRRGYKTLDPVERPVRTYAEQPPAPAGKPIETGLSTGVISTKEKARRRREKVARGEQLTQEDL